MQMYEFLIYEGLEHVLEQIVARYEDYTHAEERTDIRDYLIRKENFTVMICDGMENAYLIGAFRLKGAFLRGNSCYILLEEGHEVKSVDISQWVVFYQPDIEAIIKCIEDELF